MILEIYWKFVCFLCNLLRLIRFIPLMVAEAVMSPQEDISLNESTYCPRRIISCILDFNDTVSALSTLILNGMFSVYLSHEQFLLIRRSWKYLLRYVTTFHGKVIFKRIGDII